MSPAAAAVVIALCAQSVEPCFETDGIILLPVSPEQLDHPHIETFDIQPYRYEGVIIRPVHLGIAL